MIPKKSITIFLLIVITIHYSDGVLPVLLASAGGLMTFSNVQKGLGAAYTIYDKIKTFRSEDPSMAAFKQLFTEIHQISFQQYQLGQSLDQLKLDIHHILNTVTSTIEQSHNFNSKVSELMHYSQRINTAYSHLHKAISDGHAETSICRDAEIISSIDTGNIPDTLQNINLIAASPQSTFFSNMIQTMIAVEEQQKLSRCGRRTSFQHELFELYKFLANIELKAMTVLALSYKVREKCKGESFANNVKTAETEMVKRIIQYAGVLKGAMGNATRTIRSCAPTVQPHNEYHELVYQRTVIRNVRQLGDRQECAHYSHVGYPAVRIPMATLLDCQYFSLGVYKICITPSTAKSNRLYEWFMNPLGEYFGSSHGSCFGRLAKDRPPPENQKYYNCRCTGVYHPEELFLKRQGFYAISLKGEESDVSRNQVVTGVKLSITAHNLIHLEIQTGTAEANYTVSNMNWKPHETVNLPSTDEELVTDSSLGDFVLLGVEENQARYINLEDVHVAQDYVVTGVKLGYYGDSGAETPAQKKRSIVLHVRETPYNYMTGKLWPQRSRWTYKDLLNHDPERINNSLKPELTLTEPDNPMKAKTSKLNSNGRQYIQFRPSDLKKDAGQTTVPFVNTKAASSELGVPLQGVGFYHEGEAGFGGFIGVQVMTYDLLQHFDDTISEDDKRKYGL